MNNTLTESYGYDDLNRLTGATPGVYGNQVFVYDELDNIQQKDGRTYQYDPAEPYTLVNDGSYSYTYDANGNQTTRSDGRILVWDYDNRLVSTSDGGVYEYSSQYQ